MLKLPDSLDVQRSPKSEAALLERGRKWLQQDERKKGLHASDLMDPRQAYFKHTDPRPIQDRLVNIFLVGKIGHVIVLSSVDGTDGLNLKSDEGSEWSDELEIWFSADKTLAGIPRELKTTRSYYDAKTVHDLALYLEQLLIYMVARKSRKGQLWVLYLNLKDAEGKTAPQWRAYTVTVSEADLAAYRDQLIQTKNALLRAIEGQDPSELPLCRPFKCGEDNCEYWKQCRPPGRYGKPKSKWKD